MQCTVQTAVYANSSYWAFLFWLYYAVHLFPGFTWRHLVLIWKAPWQVGWQRVPWRHSPNRGVCLPSVDNRLQIRTAFMKLILSTYFIKKLVMTGNSFVQVWWVLFCVGAGLTIGTGRPQLVIHRKWQKLWQIIGKRDVTDAPGESQMCPSCPALRMDTRVSLRLKEASTFRIIKTLDQHCAWLITEKSGYVFHKRAKKMGHSWWTRDIYWLFFILSRQHVGLTHWQRCWTVRGVW